MAKALGELGLAPAAGIVHGDRDDRDVASTVIPAAVPESNADLAGLNALASTHYVERLQETIQRKKKLAVGKVVRVGVGMLVLAGALAGAVILGLA